MVNITASPENGAFLTQDTYRGDRSRTATLNYYSYCAGNPINYTDPSGHAIWGILGAAMGAYDGYKYAKKKKLKGWKKAAAIVGGAALGAVNPFKVAKAAKTVYKAAKYVKSARSAYKKSKSIVKAAKKTKITKVAAKKYKRQNTPSKIKKSKLKAKKNNKKLKGGKQTFKGKPKKLGNKTKDSSIVTKEETPNFEELMSAEEAARYNQYWKKDAPDFYTLGAKITHYKEHKGIIEKSIVIYDNAGRQKWRIDFNNHGFSDHSKPHLHERKYGPGYDPIRGKRERYDIWQ